MMANFFGFQPRSYGVHKIVLQILHVCILRPMHAYTGTFLEPYMIEFE